MELDRAEKRDSVYNNLEDEARLHSKVAKDVKKDSDESEAQSLLEIEDEIILAELASRR